jgi:hypothetical protein
MISEQHTNLTAEEQPHHILIKYLGNSIAVVENFYSEDEIKLIWEELESYQDKFLSPEFTKSALLKEAGLPKKQNKGLFLDEFYSGKRHISNILTINRKVYHKELIQQLVSLSPMFRVLHTCNIDNTLVSYYENSDYYKAHTDLSAMTGLSYFFKEPKSFSKGNIRFCDFDITVEIKNNMVIFFPGVYEHEVDTIIMKDEDSNKNLGRYCMAQFFNFKE